MIVCCLAFFIKIIYLFIFNLAILANLPSLISKCDFIKNKSHSFSGVILVAFSRAPNKSVGGANYKQYWNDMPSSHLNLLITADDNHLCAAVVLYVCV